MDYENNTTSLKGSFLMAMPGLIDPNFHQSVTCISEHNQDGAVGIIVNNIHPILSAKIIFQEFNIDCTESAEKIPVHMGGPVHTNKIFVLHGPPFKLTQTLMINNELAMSNSMEIIKNIAAGDGPESFIISLGCAGWGAGQLENELMSNFWLTSPYFKNILFDISIEDRWKKAMNNIGVDPAMLSNIAGHA